MNLKRTLKNSILTLCAASLPFGAFGQGDETSVGLARTLSQCNPQLIGQARRVDGSRASSEGVRSARLPSFSVSAGAFLDGTGSEDMQSSVTARVPVATFGRQAANERLSDFRVQLAEREYLRSVAAHAKELVELWVERSAIDNQIAVYQDIISQKLDLVSIVERRSQQGLSSDAELRDAQAEYISDLTDFENLRLREVAVEADIVVLACEELTVSRANVVAPQEADIQNIGTGLNPDVIVSRAELDLEKAQLDYLEVSNYPSLDLEARASLDDTGDTTSRIGFTVNYEYGNLGRTRNSSVIEAQMRMQEQENTLQFLTFQLEQETMSNYQRSKQLVSDVIPSIEQELLSYEETRQSSMRRFEAGMLTIRELLSDINRIKDAKIRLVEARQQLQIINNSLAYALGRYNLNR